MLQRKFVDQIKTRILGEVTELEELFCHFVCRGLEKPRESQSRYFVPYARSEPDAT